MERLRTFQHMEEYLLPRHVHFCRHDQALIFLNLEADAYSLIDGDNARTLWNAVAANQPITRSTIPNIDELLANGVLTSSSGARRFAPTTIRAATDPLIHAEVLTVRLTVEHVLRFAAACIVAWFRLRHMSIKRTVESVEARKARSSSCETLDLDRARALVTAFNRMRMFFPHDYLCLYDSLALLEFLARYGVFPKWVFGVRLDPWGAHCWVQEGSFVFNEDVEETLGYTPIMVV